MKNHKRATLILVVIALVFVALIIGLVVSKNSDPGEKEITNSQNNIESSGKIVEVVVREEGFEPATVTINVGDTISWKNKHEEGVHKIISGPHPTHDALPDLESGEFDVDAAYSYTFKKAGTFEYHDELNPTMSGTVIVQ